MNESQVRQSFVEKALSFLGCNEKDGSHKKIIDGYNEHKPLARGYAVKYTDSWCATFVSFITIKLGYEDIIPLECSCEEMIKLFMKKGIWNEDGRIVPEIGDIIFYNWDEKKQNNNGRADHVGIVEKIQGNIITVVEGNYSNSVKRRNVQIGNGYIRGYGQPKFEKKADKKTDSKTASSSASTSGSNVNTSGSLKVGDVVQFIGSKHYATSYSGAKAFSCKGGLAKVTAISKGSTYPYHLVAVSGKGSTVYGWVKAKDIKGVETAKTSSTIKVGDIVDFKGSKHYVSSYLGAKSSSCKPGKARVTKINKNGKYKYHLVKASGSKSTVSGWVHANDIEK